MPKDEEVIYVRVPAALKQRIATAAKDLAITQRKLIEIALADYLDGFEEYQSKPVRLRVALVAEPLAQGEQASDDTSGETK